MLNNETLKKVKYFNSKSFYTKEDLLKDFREEELVDLFLYNNDNQISNFISKGFKLNINFLSTELEKKIKKFLDMEKIDEETFNSNFSYAEKKCIYLTEYYSCQLLKEKAIKDIDRFFTDDEAVDFIINDSDVILDDALKSIKNPNIIIPYLDRIDIADTVTLLRSFKEKNIMTEELVESILALHPGDTKRFDNFYIDVLNDETRERVIKNNKKASYLIAEIIESFNDTKLKLKYLSTVKNHNLKINIIKSIKEDEIKAKLITYTTRDKGEIISSIEDDKLKESLLLKYIRFLFNGELGTIIASFNDEKLVEKYLYLLKTEKDKVEFITNSHPEKRKDLIEKLFLTLKKQKNIRECFNRINNPAIIDNIIYSTNDKEILSEFFLPKNKEIYHAVFKKLSNSKKKEIIKDYQESNKDIVYFYQYLDNTHLIYEALLHTESFPEYDQSFDDLIIRIGKYCHVKPERLLKLVRLFGLEVLTKLNNENITILLISSDKEFAQIINLFSDNLTSFDENNQNDALNAIIQRKFRLTHPREILIFTETLHAISDGDEEKVIEIIKEISEVVILSHFNITEQELFAGLISKNEEIIALYNKITNEYISILRNEYDIEEKKAAEVLYNDIQYDKNDLARYFFKNISSDIIIKYINDVVNYYWERNDFTNEEQELIRNHSLLKEIIEFKKDPKNTPRPSNCTKNDLRLLTDIIFKTFSVYNFPTVKRVVTIKKTKKPDLLSILCELDIHQMKETVLNDEEKYQELKEILDKKRIHCWINRFGELSESADLNIFNTVIASLLSNYSEVRKHIFKEESEKITIILKDFIKYNESDKAENIFLEKIKNNSDTKTDLVVMLKDISRKSNIPLEQVVKKLFMAAHYLKTNNFESALNIINPEIKSAINRDKIYQVLLKINTFKWRLAVDNTIKGSKIAPEENDLINLFITIDKVNSIIPEETESFTLENLFDATIAYYNIDLEEALKKIDPRIKEKIPEKDLEKVFEVIYTFVKKTKKNNIVTTTSIIDLADIYDESSRMVKILFGKENFDYIRRNPGPYSGQYTSRERIDMGIELLKEMHQRKYITVPPSREVYKLNNNKTIKISVGDLHNIDNLTYGERTAACMRMGGAGESLFLHCLKNENGFHVRFSDPDNNKLVSRVSGFRNGNTVFLNELRFSLSDKYSTSDIISACELFAKKLIEDSKTSSYPIDNVVISPKYAMEKSHKPLHDLGVKDIKKGFKEFYSDVCENAVVLATSNPDNSLVPVKLGVNECEKYVSLRREIIRAYGKDAMILKNQVILLDTLYNNQDFKEIEIEEPEEIIYTIQGEDWFISLDANGKIDTHIMNNSLDKEAANHEMASELTQLKEYITKYGLDDIKERNSLGGF